MAKPNHLAYHFASCAGRFALKNRPPSPSIFAISLPLLRPIIQLTIPSDIEPHTSDMQYVSCVRFAPTVTSAITPKTTDTQGGARQGQRKAASRRRRLRRSSRRRSLGRPARMAQRKVAALNPRAPLHIETVADHLGARCASDGDGRGGGRARGTLKPHRGQPQPLSEHHIQGNPESKCSKGASNAGGEF
jgi:hypothetical protein